MSVEGAAGAKWAIRAEWWKGCVSLGSGGGSRTFAAWRRRRCREVTPVQCDICV